MSVKCDHMEDYHKGCEDEADWSIEFVIRTYNPTSEKWGRDTFNHNYCRYHTLIQVMRYQTQMPNTDLIRLKRLDSD